MTEESRMAIQVARPAEEQAVIVNLRLSDERMGTHGEQARLSMLASAVSATLESTHEYELGACQMAKGFGILYCYGPDAAYLFDLIEPLIREFCPRRDSFAIVRRGGATDKTADRDRIDF